MSDEFNTYINTAKIHSLKLKEIVYGEEYRIDIYTDGEKHDESFTNLRDAEARLNQLLAEINAEKE
jgi:hypothetical protein